MDYADSDDGLSPESLTERARGKQGIVSQLTDRFDAAQIAKLDGVRIIANVAVGYDNIDVEAATRRGILVTNTPDVLTDTTADLAFALHARGRPPYRRSAPVRTLGKLAPLDHRPPGGP